MDGVFNIYKEKGFTSHDVVAIVRKTIAQKKVGHTGTLDPQAEGVLPVCVGKATKLADYIMASEKTYVADMTLGITTATQDATGEIIETKNVTISKEELERAIASFQGEQTQIPPMYSAIKVNGKKLYELAREGKEIERKERRISIHAIQMLLFSPPDKVTIQVDCSKGTYIRTLCHDIGALLGCGAHMSALKRIKSGAFIIENAVKLEQLKNMAQNQCLENALLPMTEVLANYKTIQVSSKGTTLLHNGCKIYDYFFETTSHGILQNDTIVVYDYEKKLVGLYQFVFDNEKNRTCIKPLTMLL